MEGDRSRPQLPTDSSGLSDRTFSSSSTFTPSGLTPSDRGKYQAVAGEEEDTAYRGASGTNDGTQDSVHGLRIEFSEHDEKRLSFGASVVKDSPDVSSSRGLLSPIAARSPRRQSYPNQHESPYPDDASSFDRSSPPSLYSPYTNDQDGDSIRRLRSSTSTYYLAKENEPVCHTARQIETPWKSWLTVTILVLAVYSFVFSGIWLGLAVTQPRYHKHIMTNGPLTPATASLLCAGFAKTIELSFVTVFVAMLGQLLSKDAIRKNSKGITIADMLLRQWIMQPGSLITHWETIKYAALTILGATTLTATLISMFYTTASDALVAPKLKFGGWDDMKLVGEVKTIFGNQSHLTSHCKTPISDEEDPWNAGATCMEIEHSGQAYHNYAQYLASWSDWRNVTPAGTTEMSKRPPPVAMLWDNTTIRGSWVEEAKMPELSEKYKRRVHNVTMALPHAAVVDAARLKNNSILQPQDLTGIGEYFVQASVPSPSINVICAALSEEELKPMSFVDWPNYDKEKNPEPNSTNWPADFEDMIPHTPSFLNKTAVDDVFGWGEKYGRRPPIFSKMPQPFKSVSNITDMETDSIYILLKSGDPFKGPPLNKNITSHLFENDKADPPFQLCSVRASMYPDCSTLYHASKSGGNLTTKCNSESDPLSYSRTFPNATKGVTLTNWTTVANRWATTMSLNAGITDDPASNARLLTQLIPLTPQLDPLKPSIAEAIAVMSGCTLILTALDTPLTHHWPLTNRTIIPSVSGGWASADNNAAGPPWPNFPYQTFPARVRSQEYSSGYSQSWQGIFYLVLLGTFVLNGFCLLFFLVHKGMVTDYMEPHNLFALAVNSPASKAVEGACGGGVEGGMFGTRWHVDFLGERQHFYVHSLDEMEYVGGVNDAGGGVGGGKGGLNGVGGAVGSGSDGHSLKSPSFRARKRKGTRASMLAEEESAWEMQSPSQSPSQSSKGGRTSIGGGGGGGGDSPVGEQFRRLSSRPSSLF